jgi:hypothetical protein
MNPFYAASSGDEIQNALAFSWECFDRHGTDGRAVPSPTGLDLNKVDEFMNSAIQPGPYLASRHSANAQLAS